MEKIAGEKFPDNISDILITAGFDNKTAIKSFTNRENIPIIENYVNENPLKFTEILKGTKYEHSTQFKFLPGHIALLSGLPEYLLKLNTKKQVKVKNNCTENKQLEEQINTNSDQSNSNHNPEFNGEPDTNDIKKIQQNLLKKINNYSTKKNIGILIAEENITNFRFENQSFKCLVKCPKCTKLVSCTYGTFWFCGNFQAHLKTHITVEVYEVNEHNRLTKIDDRNSSIVRIANKSQLDRILSA